MKKFKSFKALLDYIDDKMLHDKRVKAKYAREFLDKLKMFNLIYQYYKTEAHFPTSITFTYIGKDISQVKHWLTYEDFNEVDCESSLDIFFLSIYDEKLK